MEARELPIEEIDDFVFDDVEDDGIIEENGYDFDIKYRNRKFIKKIVPAWIIASTLSIMATGLDFSNKIEERTENNIVTSSVADVEVSRDEDVSILKNVEIEVPRYDLDNICFSDKIELPNGLNYYESSDHDFGGENSLKHIGDSDLPEDYYTIEGISIIIPNEDSYNVCPVVWDNESTIGDAVDSYLKNNNLEKQNVNLRIHFSDPVSGWVNYSDLVKYKDIVVIEDDLKTKETITNKSHEENFDGKISFKENGEDVTINVIDEEGALLSKGDMVIGSNKKIYSIDSLNVLNVKKMEENTLEYIDDQLLCWSVKDIALPSSMIIMGATLLGMGASLKKRKDETSIDDYNFSEIKSTQDKIKDLLQYKQQELNQLKEEMANKPKITL